MAILSTFRNSDRTAAVPNRLVDALRDEGFALIVVDTSAELPDSDIDCDLLVHRRNIGWDFGSWMSVLARFPWIIDESDNVLLINDSNVGPLRPMKNVFATGRMMDVDIWGLTDSWDISYHLQSYFLHFNTSALRSGHLESFVHSFTFPTSKERIIGAGELGLTHFMQSRGLRLGALHPYTQLADRFLESIPRRMERVLSLPENQMQADHGLLERNDEVSFLFDTAERIRNSAPVNPTHYFWDILLELGSPFVKRDLLMKNPDRISGLHRLVSVLGDEMGVSALEEEVRSWPRTHPDMSLPLAIHWRPDEY